jgi:hypothetical protein
MPSDEQKNELEKKNVHKVQKSEKIQYSINIDHVMCD